MDIPLLLAMVGLLALSAYFSASETAFSTMNRTRMKTLAQEKNKKAKLALKISEDYGKLISTILVGNNIVNISLSSIATVFFLNLIKTTNRLQPLPPPLPARPQPMSRVRICIRRWHRRSMKPSTPRAFPLKRRRAA